MSDRLGAFMRTHARARSTGEIETPAAAETKHVDADGGATGDSPKRPPSLGDVVRALAETDPEYNRRRVFRG